jgi:hypothetical protein
MTNPQSVIFGRAIFGTTQGLTAQGDGVLAGVKSRVSIFEFESGRQHEGVLHHVPTDEPALFVRRIADEAGREVNLIGLVAPCRDHLDRKGFFGSCVAVPIDQTSPKASFSDWIVLVEPLWQLYENALTLYDHASKRLRWKTLLHSSDKDRKYDWKSLDGNSVVLFANIQTECKQEIAVSEIMQRLQALTYMHGHTTTTMIVSTIELPGSTLLRGEVSDKALSAFTEAGKRATSAPRLHKTTANVQKATTEQEIEQLWDEVDRLRYELNGLKAQFGGGNHGYIRQENFDQSLQNSPFANEQNTSRYDEWVKFSLIGAAAFLGFIIAVILILFMSSEESASDARPTSAATEIDATANEDLTPVEDAQDTAPGRE